MTTSSSDSPAGLPSGASTRLTARSPEDLLAVVPVVLGFVPVDSAVMLTFGARRTFHARVDLAPSPDELPDLVDALLEPALRHGVERVVFVVYSEDASLAAATAGALTESFGREGVEVIDVLRADGRCWFPLFREHRGVPAAGVPYDVSAHPFAAQSVVEGRVTHRSRGELAASIAADPAAVAAMAAAVAVRPGPPGASEAVWVRAAVGLHLAAGTRPDDGDAARLLVALAETTVRDAAWELMTRADAVRHVAFWTDLVRRAPEGLVAPPAALLGFAAWLAGHGALAWCAIDRCEADDPGYRLAGYLGRALAEAVPPSVWDETGPGAARPA